jgi:hypothetical protein
MNGRNGTIEERVLAMSSGDKIRPLRSKVMQCLLMTCLVVLALSCDKPSTEAMPSPLGNGSVENAKLDLHSSQEIEVTPAAGAAHTVDASTAGSNHHVEGQSEDRQYSLPLLRNFLIERLGPYDELTATYGALEFHRTLPGAMFEPFGSAQLAGQANGYLSPTFRFKAPLDTVLVAPISGVITYLEWQPSKAFRVEDDWEMHITPTAFSPWSVGIDHVVSLNCERGVRSPGSCNTALTTSGKSLQVGDSVVAGQPIGYIGNWLNDEKGLTYGHTELSIFKYTQDYTSVIHYCPSMFLESDSGYEYTTRIINLMLSYEHWTTDESVYDQDSMIVPGCLYEALIEDNKGQLSPVKD